jgi:hypothetical protein
LSLGGPKEKRADILLPPIADAEGNIKKISEASRDGNYGKGAIAYLEKVQAFIKDGNLPGVILTK